MDCVCGYGVINDAHLLVLQSDTNQHKEKKQGTRDRWCHKEGGEQERDGWMEEEREERRCSGAAEQMIHDELAQCSDLWGHPGR